MRSTRLNRALVGVAAATVLVAGACSSSDDDAKKTDSQSQNESGNESGATGDAQKFAAEIEKRGEPELSKAEVPTELKITDDVVGTGKEVKEGATVTVQYSGAAASTGEVFDSSWSRGQPATFPLDGVIEGWSKGLVGMKEGGRRTLVIPAELAYGNGGPAPGDALVFVVDLISVTNG